MFLIGFALVNEMGGNFSLNFEFDFSLVFCVRLREKHKKECDFLTSFENHTYFLCFSLDLTQNMREKSNS